MKQMIKPIELTKDNVSQFIFMIEGIKELQKVATFDYFEDEFIKGLYRIIAPTFQLNSAAATEQTYVVSKEDCEESSYYVESIAETFPQTKQSTAR